MEVSAATQSDERLLIQTEMPIHTHNWGGSFNVGDVNLGSPDTVLTHTQPGLAYQTDSTTNTQFMNDQTLSVAGSSFPHNNMMPFLTLTAIIALQGIFPPRS